MTPDELLGRLGTRLSFRKRMAYAVVALVGATGSALIGVLWATEPGLPSRTQLSFAVLTAIGAAWAVVGGWAVTRRMPLFARDRVVAGWLAVAAWTLFAVGAVVVAPTVPAWLVVVVAVLGVAAATNLVVARRTRSALLRRRSELSD
jgi:hypothetical protein